MWTTGTAFDVVFGPIYPGKIYEIFGQESSGKSTFVLNLAFCLKFYHNLKIAIVDTESSYTSEYISQFFKPSEILVSPLHSEVLEFVRKTKCNILIIDSITNLVPSDDESKGIGWRARAESLVLDEISKKWKDGVTAFLISQMRVQGGAGGSFHLSGTTSWKLKHLAHFRLKLVKPKKKKDNIFQVSEKFLEFIRGEVEKNKLYFTNASEFEMAIFVHRSKAARALAYNKLIAMLYSKEIKLKDGKFISSEGEFDRKEITEYFETQFLEQLKSKEEVLANG